MVNLYVLNKQNITLV